MARLFFYCFSVYAFAEAGENGPNRSENDIFGYFDIFFPLAFSAQMLYDKKAVYGWLAPCDVAV